MKRLYSPLQQAARSLKRYVLTVYCIARTADTPIAARLIALLTAAYALSPIDLIPDFIPVLGLIDDLLIVPLGLALALRLTPRSVLRRAHRQATRLALRPVSYAGAALMVLLWLCSAWLLWRLLGNS